MHILFLTDNFPPEVNASATRVYERALYWIKWGHQVTVVTSAPNFPQGKVYQGYKNKWYAVEDMDGIRVVRVKTYISSNSGMIRRSLDFSSYMVTAFIAGLFQKQPDVIMATSPQFFAAASGWALAFVRRKPFIFELGDLWPASIAAVGVMKGGILLKIFEKFELFFYRHSAKVVALTQAFKDNLVKRGIAENKIAVVRNGVDLARYKPRDKDQALVAQLGLQGKFVLGYYGTHGMAHGLENVVSAAQLLKDQSQIVFIMLGDGAEKKKLKARAAKLQLQNILFLDPVPKQEMQKYWSILDLGLVHLKDDDVFNTVIPSKIFEAMGMAIPVLLVSPEGEASEILLGSEAGCWIPTGQPELFAKTVRDLAEDAPRVKQLKDSCSTSAKNFTRERQAQKVIDVFDEVLDK